MYPYILYCTLISTDSVVILDSSSTAVNVMTSIPASVIVGTSAPIPSNTIADLFAKSDKSNSVSKNKPI